MSFIHRTFGDLTVKASRLQVMLSMSLASHPPVEFVSKMRGVRDALDVAKSMEG